MNVIVSLLKSIIESKNIWKLIKQRTLEKNLWWLGGAWSRAPPPWIRHCDVNMMNHVFSVCVTQVQGRRGDDVRQWPLVSVVRRWQVHTDHQQDDHVGRRRVQDHRRQPNLTSILLRQTTRPRYHAQLSHWSSLTSHSLSSHAQTESPFWHGVFARCFAVTMKKSQQYTYSSVVFARWRHLAVTDFLVRLLLAGVLLLRRTRPGWNGCYHVVADRRYVSRLVHVRLLSTQTVTPFTSRL